MNIALFALSGSEYLYFNPRGQAIYRLDLNSYLLGALKCDSNFSIVENVDRNLRLAPVFVEGVVD